MLSTCWIDLAMNINYRYIVYRDKVCVYDVYEILYSKTINYCHSKTRYVAKRMPNIIIVIINVYTKILYATRICRVRLSYYVQDIKITILCKIKIVASTNLLFRKYYLSICKFNNSFWNSIFRSLDGTILISCFAMWCIARYRYVNKDDVFG